MEKAYKIVADTVLVRQINRNAVLEILRNNPIVSRTQIGQETNLSRASVTGIVRHLMQMNLVEEVGEGVSSGGRRPDLLRFNPEAFGIVTVDLNTRLAAITNLSAQIKTETPLDLYRGLKPEAVLTKIAAVIENLLREQNLEKSKVLGIGVAIPGIVDHAEGKVLFSSELNWQEVAVKSILEKLLGISTLVDNDVRMRAIGEHLFGMGQGVRNLLCIDIRDTGIGAAAILNGRLFRGGHYSMGEIGHISIVRDGSQCSCGNRGCLENYTTGKAVLSRIKNTIRAGRSTQILDLAGGSLEKITIAHLFKAAAMGDTLAVQTTIDLVYYLGLGASILINTLDPEMVVLSGSMIDTGGESFLEAVQEDAMGKILPSGNREVRIERTNLGNKAALVGACGLIYENSFQQPAIDL